MSNIKPPRPLHVALAQVMANTSYARIDRHELLSRVYSALRPVDKLRCLAELNACRQAKRGHVEAVLR
jgi:hypothetical protein